MQTYSDELAAFRKAQEDELTKDGGWLSVVGLYWLSDGDNPLPPTLRALGKLVRQGETVRLYTPSGERRLLKPNSAEKLTQGSVTAQIFAARQETWGAGLRQRKFGSQELQGPALVRSR